MKKALLAIVTTGTFVLVPVNIPAFSGCQGKKLIGQDQVTGVVVIQRNCVTHAFRPR